MSRKTIVLLSALVAIAGPLAAQGRGGGPGQNPAQFLISSATRLELTDDQLVRLAELARGVEERRTAQREQMRAARPAQGDRQAPDAETRERMRGMMESMRAQMQQDREAAIALLTPAQQARAWDLLASIGPREGRTGMRGEQRGRPGRPGGGAPQGAPGTQAPQQR